MRSRIETLMKNAGVTQQRFAKMLDISAGSLSSLLTGRTNPTNNHVMAIHKAFPNVNVNWLIFGEGEMYVGQTSEEKPAEASLFGEEAPVATAPSAPEVSVGAPQVIREIRYTDRPPRQIKEIRIFFDDGTFEVFGAPTRG